MILQQCIDVVRKLLKRTDGATMAEYALLIGLIALVCFVSVQLLGTTMSAMFKDIADAMPTGT